MRANARPRAAGAWAAGPVACRRLGSLQSPFRFTSMRPAHAAATSQPHGPDAWVRSSVDLLELTFRPLHGILRRRALDRLCVHIDDDVLGQHLGRLLACGAGEAGAWPSLPATLNGSITGS